MGHNARRTGCIFSSICVNETCNRRAGSLVSSVERIEEMPTNAALFLFLAAAVIAVFAFSSIVAWVSAPARERQARDRLALLKTLAEHPGEHARQVLDFLREEDQARARRKEREEQRGWIVGGLIVIAVGVGLGVMLVILGDRGDWTVALIPFLIGCVLLGVGALFPKAGQIRKEVK